MSSHTPPSSSSPPLNISEYHAYARTHLPKNAYDYYKSGALDEITLRSNERAFRRLKILPRVLVDVSSVSLRTRILNRWDVPFPIFIAPTAMQRMAHPEGEKATAAAAKKADTLMCLSSLSTTSMEEVASVSGDALRWFQLYVYSDRSITSDLVLRAQLSGYKAIVVTVDTPVLGTREADVRNGFVLPPHLKLANFDDEKFSKDFIVQSVEGGGGSGIQSYVSALLDKSLTWKDIEWLRSITDLPIILKGVHCADDAIKAIDCGAKGIIVSNHGARQLDGVPATIEMLHPIVTAVREHRQKSPSTSIGDCFDVYLDGGIRRGSDVFKALALGAKGVFIGRPVLWGLTHSGQRGVQHIIEMLRDELYQTMQLAGVTSVDKISLKHLTTVQTLRPKL